jgi:hypothetical protein
LEQLSQKLPFPYKNSRCKKGILSYIKVRINLGMNSVS